MKKREFIGAFSIFLITCTSLSFAQDTYVTWKAKLTEKSEEIDKIQSEISVVQKQYQQIAAKYENAKTNTSDRKSEYEKVKDAYDRGSKNIDIISPEDLVKLLKAYKYCDQDYRNAMAQEQRLEGEKKKIAERTQRLKKQKTEKEIEILKIKADMFDEQMLKPVWVKGYGESILDEDKSMKECKRLSLEYAKRDAMEKGGKMIINSVTEVEDFRLIKDVIKTKAEVQIVDQDVSADYGKPIRIMQGDLIKFTARVRLKLQSVDTYNPYRRRVSELKGYREPDAIITPMKDKAIKEPLKITNSHSSDGKRVKYGGKLANGVPFYTDRKYTVSNVPQKYIGLRYIKYACNSKWSPIDTWIKFEINKPAWVLIAWDERVPFAKWLLNDYSRTRDYLYLYGQKQKYLIFKSNEYVPTGEVTTYGQRPSDNSFYIVFLEEAK